MHGRLDAENDGLIAWWDLKYSTVEMLQSVAAVLICFVLNEAVAVRATSLNIDHHTCRDKITIRTKPGEEEIIVNTHGEVGNVKVRMRWSISRLLLLLLIFIVLVIVEVFILVAARTQTFFHRWSGIGRIREAVGIEIEDVVNRVASIV